MNTVPNNNVSQPPSTDERNDKRRLHLREIEQNADGQAASIGAALRAARLERGEDVGAVAALLKIRRDQLEAIESDDFARLPGRTYALGFIGGYARHLGLDAAALTQRFKDEENADKELSEPGDLVFPHANEAKQAPNGSILILALVIAMVIYGISYVTMPSRKSPTIANAEMPAVVVDPAPLATAPLVETPIATPTAPEAEPESPPPTFVAGNSDLSEPALPSAIIVNPTADGFATAFHLPSATFTLAQGSTAADASGADSRVTLTALEPTYVRMRDVRRAGGRGILIDRVLLTGGSFQAPNRSGLFMQTGNAGGLQVTVDGRVIGAFGKRGEVITRIPVDPSYFLERLAASR